jgi:hypothetical protein
MEKVSQRSTKSRGVSQGALVSSHRECLAGWVSWDKLLTDPSIVFRHES